MHTPLGFTDGYPDLKWVASCILSGFSLKSTSPNKSRVQHLFSGKSSGGSAGRFLLYRVNGKPAGLGTEPIAVSLIVASKPPIACVLA